MTAVDTQGIDGAAIEGLAANFQGRLVTPDDPDYDQVRQIWNGHIQRRPALIARCTGVADVIAAVRFGREHGLNPRRCGAAGTPSPATPCATTAW